MKNRNILALACTSFILGGAFSTPVLAEHHEMSKDNGSVSRDTTDKASDAWREGKLDTLYLFNRHLNNFSIDPEVRGNTVTLIGKVDSNVDKDLAEELAKGIDGITNVDNQLTVVPSDEARENYDENDRTFSEMVEDSTLTAEVKTKLLANSQTSGMQINVDTAGREVTLSGKVDSDAEKDLAGQIAENVDGVSRVNNKLTVKAG
jgi:osmotically-inducible protein OsmY